MNLAEEVGATQAKLTEDGLVVAVVPQIFTTMVAVCRHGDRFWHHLF